MRGYRGESDSPIIGFSVGGFDRYHGNIGKDTCRWAADVHRDALHRAMWRKREFTMADAAGEEQQVIMLNELNKPPPPCVQSGRKEDGK